MRVLYQAERIAYKTIVELLRLLIHNGLLFVRNIK